MYLATGKGSFTFTCFSRISLADSLATNSAAHRLSVFSLKLHCLKYLYIRFLKDGTRISLILGLCTSLRSSTSRDMTD